MEGLFEDCGMGDGLDDFSRAMKTITDAEGSVVGSIGKTKSEAISDTVVNATTTPLLIIGAFILGGIILHKTL